MDQLNTQLDYEFEGFRLDTRQQVLIPAAGEPIRLSPRVFQTLLYLVQHAGEGLDKRSLMTAVWSDVVVEENNLNQVIATLRKLLGETAADRRFILTLPGRGFKFVGAVRAVFVDRGTPGPAQRGPDVADIRERPSSESSAPATEPRRRKSLMFGIGLVVLAITAGLAATWLSHLRRGPVTIPAEYEALTDEVDSASAPALSPDGRMLAYIRGGSQFFSSGQIYVKWLPGGQPVRITNVEGWIYAPAFSPDGGRVAFTHIREREAPRDWETWDVPVIGGEPTRLMPNASGLSWIGPDILVYSEVKSGAHMGIVTSTESRAEHREIYFPGHERAMAHFSFVSPDRKSVLISEMDGAGNFQTCRLVPFNGGSQGTAVGPAGTCLSAAWSPDGTWMYFAADVGGHSHIWRQRFPDGQVEQITFGPTEEMAVVTAPDGRSLITSLGSDQTSIWMHEAKGDRRLTADKSVQDPWLSGDEQHLYFLRGSATQPPTELMRLDLLTLNEEPVLPGFSINTYDISPDASQVVFTTQDTRKSQIWMAATDRRYPPVLIAEGGDQARFGGNGRIFYRQIGARTNFLYVTDSTGAHPQRVLNAPILDLFGASPDGKWVSVGMVGEHGIAETHITDTSTGAVQWMRQGWWPSRWSPDGSRLYLEVDTPQADGPDRGRTWVVPASMGSIPADLSAPGADAVLISHSVDFIAPGGDMDSYVFVKVERSRNIYRIPLH